MSMTSQLFDKILRQNLIFNERQAKETSLNQPGFLWMARTWHNLTFLRHLKNSICMHVDARYFCIFQNISIAMNKF